MSTPINKPAAMVVGGGIAGIQASLNLADMGYHVYLLEKKPAAGGIMPMLGKTFPTNDCSICILSPKLADLGRHSYITVFCGAELLEWRGEAGNFTAIVRVAPRGVELEKCTSCGDCVNECPVAVDDEFNQELNMRKAIYKLYPQAYPNAYSIDRDNCIDCGGCSTICPNKAVIQCRSEEVLEIDVGVIILCPGFTLTDPRVDGEYRYRNLFPGVLTSLEFERLLSASGPLQGKHLLHLASGREIKKAAWVQCAGSREQARERGYCSSVCCMYAVKQAMVAKEFSSGSFEAVIFYTDMRVFGKGFEKFYRQAIDSGVRFVRARISEIKARGEKHEPVSIKYIAEGNISKIEEFDLAVLSMGLAAPEMHSFSQKNGISLNSSGFCNVLPFSGIETSIPGVYAAGVFTGPKDISDTVTQAGAAAMVAANILGAVPPLENKITFERDITGEELRIGVVVCCCGGNIDKIVNVEEVVQEISSLPGVKWCEKFVYACSQNNLTFLQGIIRDNNLNRLVVAACSPRTHRPLFQDVLQEAGINRYLAEMANIRDQCSWVHQNNREAATQKAKDITAMTVLRTAYLKPLQELTVGVKPAALVVGGGVAGMSCALSLAGHDYQVHLVEKESELGGNARKIHFGFEGNNVQSFIKDMVEGVLAHPLIKVYAGREVESVSGYIGNFTTVLTGGESIEHGTAVIAAGGKEEKPEGFLYGEHPGVMTLLELESCIASTGKKVQEAKSIVFVQCAGSRNESRPYCSRVCCSTSIRLALALKNKNSELRLTVLYRDMVTYGFLEEYYRQARDKGVFFVRYPDNLPPEIEENGKQLKVNVFDSNLNVPVTFDADLVALAAPVVPENENNARLSGLLKVPLNEDGFFLEAHMKLAPVDTASAGVFLCGLAHAPKNIEESVIQGRAAASRAATILARKELKSNALTARVKTDKCVGCLTCVRLCPFSAPFMKNNRAYIQPLVCRGCGVCAGECPNKAITLEGYNDESISNMVKVINMEW